jgi:ABC-type polysaccharide/polyol phosphate transport system ATPase subunit
MANDVAISFQQITKQYKLTKQTYGQADIKYALKNITLEIKEGERWGIIGRNGSGKSTLLKIMAGIIKPTSGSITFTGSISHILEVGSNFIPELSGRENLGIFFRTHGFAKQQVRELIANAMTLADIGAYFEEAVKNYSSGMYLRLAFAASIQLSADILLIDEIFSVGDIAFREKLKTHFSKTFTNSNILLLVSHNPEEIVTYCTHCLWLEQGEIRMQGPVKDVEAAYYYQLAKENSELNYLAPTLVNPALQKGVAAFSPVENVYLAINSFSVSPVEGSKNITYDAGMQFNIEITKKVSGITLHPQIIIYDYLMRSVLTVIPHAHSLSEKKILEQKDVTGKISFEIHLQPHLLTFGNFYAELRFGKDDASDKVFNEEAIRLPVKIHFEIKQGRVHDYIGGTGDVFVKPECKWAITVL